MSAASFSNSGASLGAAFPNGFLRRLADIQYMYGRCDLVLVPLPPMHAPATRWLAATLRIDALRL